jgi:hypothetical protein
MLRCGVVGGPFHRSECALTGNAAPELFLHFLPATLFKWVRAAA